MKKSFIKKLSLPAAGVLLAAILILWQAHRPSWAAAGEGTHKPSAADTLREAHIPEEIAPYLDYLKEANKLVSNDRSAYSYDISLMDAGSHQVLDRISGRLYRDGSNFLDSNKAMVSLLYKGVFFKVDHLHRQAYVFDVATVAQNMGVNLSDINTRMLDIPDSLMARAGVFNRPVYEGGNMYVTYTLNDTVPGDIRKLTFSFDAATHAIRGIKVFSAVSSDGERSVQQVCFLHDFSVMAGDRHLDPGKYFRTAGKKVQLLGSISNYKLTSNLQ